MHLALIPGVNMPGWMEGVLILLAIMLLFGAKHYNSLLVCQVSGTLACLALMVIGLSR